jgi:uroporphyrinogen-III decarboxylase
VELILERGGCFYYPLKIFERFEFRYMKKMVDAFAKEGLITVMHFDQDWTLNLPYLLDLPKKMCVCELDSTTDIFKAKEVLKDHMCIMGDVPASLSSIGTPAEMTAYCEKLIDHIGKGRTGFILSTGCTIPFDTKFENFQAMIDSAKNHLPPD